MKSLTDLIKKNLLFNRGRTIVTIISIILSGALICGVATLIVSFQKFLIDVTIENNGNYHAVINNVPSDKREDIANNKYIKTTMTSIVVGYSKLKHINVGTKPYLYIEAYDSDMFNNMPIKLLSGRLPKKDNEIIIGNSVINDAEIDYKIGDNITLNVGKRFSIDYITSSGSYYEKEDGFKQDTPYMGDKEFFISRETFDYKIVGIYETSRRESSLVPGYTVLTYNSNKYINRVNNVTLYVILKNPKNIFNKMDDIAKSINLPKNEKGSYDIKYNSELLRWYGVSSNNNAMKVLYIIGAILIGVIMIASIIVIYNSFNISITERKKQLGMLASIGASSKQIRNMVMKEGLILGLFGIPIGILSGIIGIGITLQIINNLHIFATMITSKLHLVISLLAVIVTIVFGGLTIFISGLIPAIKASRTSPIDAIRLTSDIKIKGKKLRTSKWVRKLFGIEGEIGLKNMKRNKRKYRSTIISIFVSIVLFMTVNAFAEYSFRSSLKVYNNFNFNIGLEASQDFYDRVIKLKNIDRYSIIHSLVVDINVDKNNINQKIINQLKGFYNETTNKYQLKLELFSIGDNEFKRFIEENNENINEYNNIKNPKAILFKTNNYYLPSIGKYYELLLANIKSGDNLNIYEANQNIGTINIGKLTNVVPTGFTGITTPIGTMYGIISDKLYNNFSNSLKTDQNVMAIKSSNPKQLVNDINLLKTDLNTQINVQNLDEMVTQLKNVILAISIFLYGFIILVSLIAITNVINTITTSIYLRRSEFATIKAIGMTDKAFRRMIRYESIFYGLKALIYGLTVGIILDYLLFKNIGSIFVYDYKLPLQSIFICVIFVFIIVFVTMAYSVNKIKKDNIIEVIRNENI